MTTSTTGQPGLPDLSGRVALITGGTSGIGLATAEALLEAGAVVTISGRNQERGQHALDRLRSRAPADSVTFHRADSTVEDDVVAVVDGVRSRHGALHVAVNAAANTDMAADVGPAFTDMSMSTFDGIVRTVLTSVWLCMKHELPGISASGGGAIINISSIDALLRSPGTGPYAAAKAGVNALSRAAAAEYASQGIRINVVSPGAIQTPMLERNLEADTSEARRALLDRYLDAIAARRLGQPHEVAAAVTWLASDQASYVVGHNLVIDGAVHGT